MPKSKSKLETIHVRDGELQFGNLETAETALTLRTSLYPTVPLSRELKRYTYVTKAVSNVNDKNITVELPKAYDRSCYIPSQFFLYLTVSILHQTPEHPDGTVPPLNVQCAPVNCVPNSLFKKVKLCINGDPVSRYESQYGYTAFFTQLLSQGQQTKNTVLGLSGYYEDSYDRAEDSVLSTRATDLNEGFQDRRSLFLDKTNHLDFSNEPVRFVTKIFHELATSDQPIWNCFNVSLEFERAADSFSILHNQHENDKYFLKIHEMQVQAGLVTYRYDIWSELKMEVAKHKGMYRHFFDNILVTSKVINMNQETAEIPDLWPTTSAIPKKLYIALVDGRAFTGHPLLNPYEFRHRWSMDKHPVVGPNHQPFYLPGHENAAISRSSRRSGSGWKDYASSMWQYLSGQQPRGQVGDDDQEEMTNRPSCSKTTKSGNQQPAADGRGPPPPYAPRAADMPGAVAGEEDEFWLKELVILKDGQLISQLEKGCDRFTVENDYHLLNLCENSYDLSYISHGISYAKFNGGLYIKGYDLTAGKTANMAGTLSSLSLGDYTARVVFNRPIPYQMRLVVCSVSPQYVTLNTEGKGWKISNKSNLSIFHVSVTPGVVQ